MDIGRVGSTTDKRDGAARGVLLARRRGIGRGLVGIGRERVTHLAGNSPTLHPRDVRPVLLAGVSNVGHRVWADLRSRLPQTHRRQELSVGGLRDSVGTQADEVEEGRLDVLGHGHGELVVGTGAARTPGRIARHGDADAAATGGISVGEAVSR